MYIRPYYVITIVRCKRCDGYSNNNGLCYRCGDVIDPYICNETNSILNEYCKTGYYEKFCEYFNMTNFTQAQLRHGLQLALLLRNNSVIETILLSYKFYPDNLGYDFFHMIPQSILSVFFHKRFLIKLYLESQNLQCKDFMPYILDPCLRLTYKPYSYMKFLFHNTLFPQDQYIDDKIYSNKFIESKTGVKLTLGFATIYGKGSCAIFNDYLISIINENNFYFVGKNVNGVVHELNSSDISIISQFSHSSVSVLMV